MFADLLPNFDRTELAVDAVGHFSSLSWGFASLFRIS